MQWPLPFEKRGHWNFIKAREMGPSALTCTPATAPHYLFAFSPPLSNSLSTCQPEGSFRNKNQIIAFCPEPYTGLM